jgi:hypothetical protein
VNSLQTFRNVRLTVRVEEFVPTKLRAQLMACRPQCWCVIGCGIHYDVEEQNGTVPHDTTVANSEPLNVAAQRTLAWARLRLPERLARTLTTNELPVLDRPLRFIVTRGQRGAVRAQTLDELQDLLEGPWTPTEGGANESGFAARYVHQTRQRPTEAPSGHNRRALAAVVVPRAAHVVVQAGPSDLEAPVAVAAAVRGENEPMSPDINAYFAAADLAAVAARA